MAYSRRGRGGARTRGSRAYSLGRRYGVARRPVRARRTSSARTIRIVIEQPGATIGRQLGVGLKAASAPRRSTF